MNKTILLLLTLVLTLFSFAYSETTPVKNPDDTSTQTDTSFAMPKVPSFFNASTHENNPVYLTDIPTAYTPLRGNWTTSFKIKTSGGILFRTYLGVTDFLSVGVATSMNHLIGGDSVNFDTPGIGMLAKIRIYPGAEKLPTLLFGYDPFIRYDQLVSFYGKDMSYGEGNFGRVYLVASNGWRFIGLESRLHYGFNSVVQNSLAATSAGSFIREYWYRKICIFAGMDVSLTKELSVFGEVDKINFWSDELYMKDPNYNFGVRYTMAPLSVEFDFRYTFIVSRNMYQFERNIKVDFKTKLF